MQHGLGPSTRSRINAMLAAFLLVGIAFLGGQTASPVSAAPCDPPIANPIVCENSKTGNPASEWDVTGAGSTSIQGFATDISANRGQSVSFKVKTDASDYRIDIYRLGYYNGLGARKIATVQPSVSLPQVQPSCLVDDSTGLVDCGNWSVSASWSVPSTAVSGIYVAKLVRESGTTGASHMVFIVRDDDSHSDILFQTSDTTWQAYNAYGGNSLYTGSPVGRAYKVSYNRPFTTRQAMCCTGSVQSFLFSAEYPMIRWLERNGYDVTYFTGVDSDRRGGEIQEHAVFLSVGHDEYWSEAQRNNVEAARDSGTSLAFFSGNEAFWKTRWETSIDGSGTPYRTLVAYKETHAGAKIDPSPEWTGTWRDPRFSPPSDGGRPENSLTGTLFMVNGPSRNDPMLVPAAEGKLRFWRNTTVASLPPDGIATLPTGVLGFEWDEDVDNGFRPAGSVRLSKTTLSVGSYLLDHGSTFGGGTATHRLTMYRAGSGALVFGAGTIQWSWGLDATHDVAPCCPAPSSPDSRMQQATVNLLADMGIQPGTLQSGLTAASASTDNTAPTSTITSPLGGATIIGPITITGNATDTGGGRVGGVEVSLDGGATWHPADGQESWSYTWSPATIGTATLKSRAVDDSGNIGAASPGVNVTTVAASAGFNDLIAGRPLDGEYPAGQITWGADQWFISPPYGGFETNSISFTEGLTAANLTFIVPRRFVSVEAVNTGPTTSSVSIACPGHTTKVQTLPQNVVVTINTGWTGGCTTATITSSNGWDTNFDNFLFDDAGIPADTTPPVVTGVQAGPNGGKATISWTTDENSDTQVEYGPTTAYGFSTPLNTTLVSTHTATISGLTLGTTYHYRVKSRDAWGNLATSGDFTFVAECPCTMWDASALPAVTSAPDTTPLELGVKFQSDTAGYISGLRFYKGTNNTGQHDGHLWSATGQLIASATFTNETGTGWQEVSFPAPVLIAANTTYVASYFAPAGGFSYTRPYFNAASDAPPLHALADVASGGNGVFRWGSSGFPSSTFQATNYWVDVVFNTASVDTVPPGVMSQSPAAGATAVSPGTAVAATFTEPVTPSSISFGLRDSGNSVVPSSVTYDAPSRTVTLQPNALLNLTSTYTATLGGATDPGGNAMQQQVWSFTTGGAAASIWAPSATPAIASQSDNSALEIGVKFRSDISGYIRGVRFYKGPANTGLHIGNLWSSTGQLIATATFTGETGTGWQQVLFSAPVAVTANTTYVASYFAPNGGYSLNQNFFTSAVLNWPLRALADGTDGPNGLYRYGQSAFPNQSYGASNYWVDVLFSTTSTDTVAPTVTSKTPAAGATKVSPSNNVSATFSEPINQASLSFTLRNGQGQVIASAVTYSSSTNTATLNPSSDLALDDTFTAKISASDPASNAMPEVSWSFSTPQCPCTIWAANATPATAAQNDSGSIELGVKFRSEISGFITGVRFYKGAGNSGTHIGNLWSSSGVLLATATFSGETASGWQEVTFGAPVAVTANTTYVASYFAPNGHYAIDVPYFTTEVVSWPLRALETGAAGGNGVYNYGSTSSFPTNSWNGSNYWVDVAFSPTVTDTIPPTVTNRSPAVGATGVATTADVTVTFSEPINQTSLSFVLRDSSNNVVASTVTYDSLTRIAKLDPNANLGLGKTYTARVDVQDVAGNPMSQVSWSFTTVGCPCSLWPASAIPAVPSQSDSSAVTLGVKFQSDVAGQITAIRFYKGAVNTGTHVAHLWTAAGSLLATATFAGETASGWQQVSLATPVTITTNTTYVVSYHAPNGGYSTSANYFNVAYARYPLSALAGGNGVYAYGPSGTFPSSSYNATNYWVDVIFTPTP
jgi:methionine-rich copper-binding protein CopC